MRPRETDNLCLECFRHWWLLFTSFLLWSAQHRWHLAGLVRTGLFVASVRPLPALQQSALCCRPWT